MKIVRGFLAVMFFVGLALAVLPPSTAQGCHVGDFDNNCVSVSATSLVGPGDGYNTLVSPALPYLIHTWAPGETQYSYSISTRWQKLVSDGHWDSISRPKQGNNYLNCPSGYSVDPSNYKKCVKWVDPVYSYKNETITGKVYKPTDCTPPPDKKVTICHVAGRADDPANYITLTISENAVYGPGGHFNENGTPQAGHEQDSFGACVPPTPPPYVPCSVTVDVAGAWSDWATDPTNALQEVRSQTISSMDSVNSTLVCGSRVVTETRSKECAVGQLINSDGQCYTPPPTDYCSVEGVTVSVPYGQEPPAGATVGACVPVEECLAPNTLVDGVCTPPVVVTPEPPPVHVDPPVEICGNQWDDDEDGQINEGCVVAQVTGAEVPNLPWTKAAGLLMSGVGLIGFGLSFKK